MGSHGDLDRRGHDLVLDRDVGDDVADRSALADTRGVDLATASTSFSSVRPQIVTCAPSAASRVAAPRPMPLPPPVTSAVLPVMVVIGVPLLPAPGDARELPFIRP